MFLPEFPPTNVSCEAVVAEPPVLFPTPTLLLPVVLASKAKEPTAVLASPVVFTSSDL